jgi:acylphosphatase
VSTVRRRVVVTGRVQGVVFRHSVAQEAGGRRVAGWVTNRPDGAVEAVFEGPADDVDALVAWMRHGPPHAQVEATQVTQEQAQGEQRFRVR